MMEVVELLLSHIDINIWHPMKLMLRCWLCCKQEESRFAGLFSALAVLVQ